MIDLDPILADAVTRDTIDLKASPGDVFSTGGMLQWDVEAPGRLRSGHVLDMKGATIVLDPDRVTDAMLLSQQPIMMLGGQIGQIAGKTGEDAWAAVLTHQSVVNARFVGNFSVLQPRAAKLGVPLRLVACGLQGHDAQMRGIRLSDFGAFRYDPARGAEAFPVWISGADSGYDTNALYTVHPSHEFDENTPVSGIEYTFEDYQPDHSNDQVTVGLVVGATCSEKINLSPWKQLGPWRQIMRRGAWLKYDVKASGVNSVQGGTVYQSRSATIDGKSQGAAVGYYSDYLRSQGVHILPTCSFKGGIYGVMVRLSPTAADSPELAEQFSAEDFVIEKFECDAKVADVFVNADLLEGATKNPPTRYLRNIAVDERLRIAGNKEGLVLIPAPGTKKKGCNPFRR